MTSWASSWQAETRDIRDFASYQACADRLRALIKTKQLLYTDIESDPAKFFLAHRLLVDPLMRGPGFCIRFTVQFNLFAGTILGLGGEEQIRQLDDYQAKGVLGCFALTEKFAGVNSGLVVNTVAVYDPSRRGFVLDSPNPGAEKNWISQGLTADVAVVFADLRVKGKSLGPHGFVLPLRGADGHVLNGITLTDMGAKTIGNDLDNASIRISGVFLPRSALLNRYCDVNDAGEYVQKTAEKMRIEVIGQRLLTGRIAVSQAALEFAKKLFAATQRYADGKKTWMPGNDVPLASHPHIAALFAEAAKEFTKLDRFSAAVEQELCQSLQARSIPTAELVERIAVAKIGLVEKSLQLCFRLKQEVGSYALMVGTGFESVDFITCCKFAEGDSRILQQKLARDHVRMKTPSKFPAEVKLIQEIRASKNPSHTLIYELAEVIVENTISEASKL